MRSDSDKTTVESSTSRQTTSATDPVKAQKQTTMGTPGAAKALAGSRNQEHCKNSNAPESPRCRAAVARAPCSRGTEAQGTIVSAAANASRQRQRPYRGVLLSKHCSRPKGEWGACKQCEALSESLRQAAAYTSLHACAHHHHRHRALTRRAAESASVNHTGQKNPQRISMTVNYACSANEGNLQLKRLMEEWAAGWALSLAFV